MIPSLRKSHLRIWAGLAIVLPVGVMMAWLAISLPVTSDALRTNQISPFEELVKEKQTPNWNIALRSRELEPAQQDALPDQIKKPLTITHYQLEVERKSASEHPSTVFYLSEKEAVDDISTLSLLGAIGPVGIYRFNFPEGKAWPDDGFVVIVDGIRKEVIQTIQF